MYVESEEVNKRKPWSWKYRHCEFTYDCSRLDKGTGIQTQVLSKGSTAPNHGASTSALSQVFQASIKL